jgi:hypothetical protein
MERVCCAPGASGYRGEDDATRAKVPAATAPPHGRRSKPGREEDGVPRTVDDQLDLVGRLCLGPAQARRERLELLGALLATPADGWAADALRRASPLASDATEAALRGLKRAGALVWSNPDARYRIPPPARQAVVLVHLLNRAPVAEEDLIAGQEQLFALAEDGSALDPAPLASVISLLAQDVAALERAQQRPLPEQVAAAALLGRHVADARRVLDQLAAGGVEPGLVEQGVALVARLAGGVAALVERLARQSADMVPRAGASVSPSQLRERARSLPVAVLAALVGSPSAAPRAISLPREDDLAAALRVATGRRLAIALPPAAAPVSRAADEPPPDALDVLIGRIERGAPPRLAALVAGCEGWSEAVRAHHGMVRLHEQLVRAGRGGVEPTGEVVEHPAPGVASVSEAVAAGWQAA